MKCFLVSSMFFCEDNSSVRQQVSDRSEEIVFERLNSNKYRLKKNIS